ncbi:MAG: thiamine pyrophosphate-dependent enzyme [Desulfobacteraceae bacterium]|nr:thiamine pyrophosphate-dependent enzyme [Desulfobacteraceae bacterium]MDH3720574.1 thiamine pyrophosphate-dependent enzyme [Desulfobacteraceae bacterium]MDH3836057.1 thiamine pyrophosphate-dependent enzyme [Desulfobacteraceae bacterium]MDH3872817.1 thiamine pyrophosphate-dependent enzyme [Desulfobacteraceae bacterium]MDH3955367.1 thiamine pyrophosphate-dependent enzyme [Desulfobacteraceae bacterium]
MNQNAEELNKVEKKDLFTSGHRACGGCGQALAARLVQDASGENTIACVATGCLEVFSSPYPDPSWRIPFLHSLFENASAVASGVEAAYKALKKGPVNIIAQGGDGSTADIGFQSISGMFERGHNVLYVCYDNEAYMNTGVQRSSFTPYGARTSTTPMGNKTRKKNMPLIAADHGIPYVATATVDDFRDLQRKVKTALSIEGPKYIHILAPCPLGWGHHGELTVQICRLAKDTGLFPIYEIIDGKLANVKKIRAKVPVEEYLKLQGRFSHLFKKGGSKETIAEIQNIANQNIERYNL